MQLGLFRLPGATDAEGLAAFQKPEIDKWWPIIKAAGVKAE
jgi:hypothetical protein